ncbi:RNA polymerase sigma factor [Rhodohalobacter sp. SW132]|uniref:RNA polymerase sigma factor n=1 Tax=Rhodohalobacter sp. SW132 TaxID=2293433 RepID=UPI0013151EDD|nr:RNA polymerase sigma factor [Rhodohalobacter sp. SW132]
MKSNDTVKQMDDTTLWSNVLEGDKEALSSLYHTYHNRLFNYGYRIVAREDFVEDCIQELFLTIWEKHYSISEAKSVKAYLYISMRRTIFKNLRKYRNQQNRNLKYAKEREQSSLTVEDFLIESEYQNEFKQKLEVAINSLSKRGREVIYLKYYDGMSNAEIATLMDIKRQSVYNHVSEALSEMQQFVE